MYLLVRLYTSWHFFSLWTKNLICYTVCINIDEGSFWGMQSIHICLFHDNLLECHWTYPCLLSSPEWEIMLVYCIQFFLSPCPEMSACLLWKSSPPCWFIPSSLIGTSHGDKLELTYLYLLSTLIALEIFPPCFFSLVWSPVNCCGQLTFYWQFWLLLNLYAITRGVYSNTL